MIADVVEAVVTTVVDVTNFLTASSASFEAFKTANLLKGLSVNAMIMGERGTGKLTLARTILPSAPIINGDSFDELLSALETNDAVIIHRLDGIANLKRLEETVKKTKTRIIATGGFRFSSEQLENIFSIRLLLPPLRERPEDIALLTDRFAREASETFAQGDDSFSVKEFLPDVSENALSLRRQVYLQCLLESIDENNLMEIMEQFLIQRLGSNNDYRTFLHLYEVPLIRAGIKRFKSQLQLSDKLGLNRNTLRKKIAEHAEYKLEIKES
ncbi:MAG: Fis family transcriptional regulator [Sulfurimonas sp.]